VISRPTRRGTTRSELCFLRACLTGLRFGHWATKTHRRRTGILPRAAAISPAHDSFPLASDYSPARAIPSLPRIVPHLPPTLPLASLAASDSWHAPHLPAPCAPPLFIISSSSDGDCPFPPPSSSLLPHPSLCSSFASLLAC